MSLNIRVRENTSSRDKSSGHGVFSPLYLAGIKTKNFPEPPIELAAEKIKENIYSISDRSKEMLSKLEGKKILVVPDDIPNSFVITLTLEGTTTEYVDENQTYADVTLSGPLFALINLLNDNNDSERMLFFRHVNVSGDKNIIRDLNVALKRD